MYHVADIEGQLRNTIVGRMTDTFGSSSIDFLDMAGNQSRLGAAMLEGLRPGFGELGLALDNFVVESISLPEELQKMLDQRIGMNMIGDMGRYTQFQMANSMPIAAANEGGGGVGAGIGLGAGLAMGQQMMNAMKPAGPGGPNPGPAPVGPVPSTPAPAGSAPAAAGPAAATEGNKFCISCGKPMPRIAKFCPECGSGQG